MTIFGRAQQRDGSPLGSGTMTWCDASGRRWLTVCVKVAFHLRHGDVSIRAPQTIGMHGEIPYELGALGIHAPSDFVPIKRRCDVLVVGSAHAPRGRPATCLGVRARVASIDKSLEVHGDRTWLAGPGGLEVGPVTPFSMMPLRWERAPRTGQNQLGLHYFPRPGARLPNIDIVGSGNRAPGLGPLPLAVRAPIVGASAAGLAWAEGFARQGAVCPDEGAEELFNAAPLDQQLGALAPSVPILLENLHAEMPIIETVLPDARPVAVVRLDELRTSADVPLRMDTLWIDASQALAVVSWRGRVPAEGLSAGGCHDVLVELEEAAHATSSFEAGVTADGASPSTSPVLPFEARAPVVRGSSSPPSHARETESFRTQVLDLWSLASHEPEHGRVEAAVSEDGLLEERTSDAPSECDQSALPFQSDWPIDDAPSSEDWDGQPPESSRTDLLTAPASPPASPAEPAEAVEAWSPACVPRPASLDIVPPPYQGGRPVLPPFEGFSPRAYGGPDPAAPDPADASPASAPVPEEPMWLEAEEVDLETAGSIAAALDLAPDDRETILLDHHLRSETWESAEERWSDAVTDALRRGEVSLLETHDAAYVGRLESERGPLSVDDHARLEIAMRRGTSDQALAALELPSAALIRLKRVHARRLLREPDLASAYRRALSAASKKPMGREPEGKGAA